MCRIFIIRISNELYGQQYGYVVYLLSVLVMNYMNNSMDMSYIYYPY